MTADDNEVHIILQHPFPDERVFRYQAMQDVLDLFIRNPHESFSNSDIRRLTEHGGESVHQSLKLLTAMDLITYKEAGKRKQYSMNRDRLQKPEDPILSIPQEEFRTPVREFLQKLRNRVDYLAGVVLFGSVATGDADRASDIDIWILVEDNLTESRRKVTDIVQEFTDSEREERFEFQALTESVDSADRRGDKLTRIFQQGIVLDRSKALDDLKEEVLHGG